MPTATSFNLIDRPFLPVATSDGPATLSLRDVLVNAHNVVGIDTSNPTAAIALYRFLLAVVIDATGQPADMKGWRSRFDGGRFPHDRLDVYFDRWHDRFDLLEDGHPFYQVPELEPASGTWRSVALLRPEVASGNNVPLFSSDTESTLEALDFAEAAVLLISCMSWDTAAIKTGASGDPAMKGGKTTGNPTGPLGQLGVVLPLGRSLFETLTLSLPMGPASEDDKPAWRQDWSPAWSQHQPAGIRELLTWQSRRIRLLTDGEVVTKVTVCAGDRMMFTPPDLEPHCLWRMTKPSNNNAVTVSQRPVRHLAGRSAWRGLNALLSLEPHTGNTDALSTSLALRQIGRADRWLGDDYPLDALCVGIAYGNQSAVIEDVMADTVPLPLKALNDANGEPLREVLLELVNAADSVRKALNGLDANIRRAEGGDAVPWDAGDHPGDAFMPELDLPTLRVLRGLQKNPDLYDQGKIAWQAAARASASKLANQLLDGASASAISGHRSGNRNEPLRLSDAEGIFWYALNQALPDRTTNFEEER